MNKLLWYVLGYEIMEISGGSPQWAINALTHSRIPFWNMQWLDAFTVQICIFQRDADQAAEIIRSKMCETKRLRTRSLFRACSGLFHRPLLLLLTTLSVVVVLLLPKFLWFYEVTGNETVPDAQILRELDQIGVGLGTYGPNIHPKWIKDHMLEALPQLEWLTVTQNGCKAQVVVRERPPAPKTLQRRECANVIATKDGLITEQSVLAGQALHKVGDIVLRGEKLVSGIVDLETRFIVQYAQADIFARTWLQIAVKTPAFCLQKRQTEGRTHSIWLEVGNKRIKIFGNSGISYDACDKMVNRKLLSLPGNHKLPVAVVLETYIPCQLSEMRMDAQWTREMMEHYICQRVKDGMQAGEILETQLQFSDCDRYFLLKGTVECQEMIAETVEAKWNEEDFKHD